MDAMANRIASGSAGKLDHSAGTTEFGPARTERGQGIVMMALTTAAPELLRTARRHSLCADDAQDAYQRTVEILLRRADSLDPDRAINWLHTVIKHEAMAVRKSRQQLLDGGDDDLDRRPSEQRSPEDHAIETERISRAAEALKRLKPQEVKALWLKAEGLSYAEIAERESWTYTKVNRCITEGRRSFLQRYASIESGSECGRWQAHIFALVDGEATVDQLAELRPHLRNCSGCRSTLRELREGDRQLSVILPAGLLTGGLGAGESVGVGSLASRAWDWLAGFVGDRAGLVGLKVQAAGEALGGAKVAAVAASAVVAAGGGTALVSQGPGRAPSARLSSPAAPIAAEPFDPKSLARIAVSERREPAKHKKAASEFSTESHPDVSSAQVGAEFGPEQAAASSPSHRSTSPRPTPSASNGAEFDP